MTTHSNSLDTLVAAVVDGATIDLDAEPRHQVGYDREGMNRLLRRTTTSQGRDRLHAALQDHIELVFAERDVNARTLQLWGIAHRLRDKLFASRMTVTEDGRAERDGSGPAPFPLEFDAADIAWMELHLTRLRSRYNTGATSEREFDKLTRALLSRPPRN